MANPIPVPPPVITQRLPANDSRLSIGVLPNRESPPLRKRGQQKSGSLRSAKPRMNNRESSPTHDATRRRQPRHASHPRSQREGSRQPVSEAASRRRKLRGR